MLGVVAMGDGATFGSRISVRLWGSYGKIENCKQSIQRELGEVV